MIFPVWSKSRAAMFAHCKREYFLYFHCNRLAAAEEFLPEHPLIRKCRKCLRGGWHLYQIVREVLRGGYYTPEEFDIEVWREFKRRREVAPEEFFELNYASCSTAEFDRSMRETLHVLSANYAGSGVPELLAEAGDDRLSLEFPLTFMVRGVKVYAAPFALLSDGNGFRFLELSGHRRRETAALEQYYMFSRFKVSPDRTATAFYNFFDGETEEISAPSTDLAATVTVVVEEAAKMAAEFTEEAVEKCDYKSIPPTPEHCPYCRFRILCNR